MSCKVSKKTKKYKPFCGKCWSVACFLVCFASYSFTYVWTEQYDNDIVEFHAVILCHMAGIFSPRGISQRTPWPEGRIDTYNQPKYSELLRSTVCLKFTSALLTWSMIIMTYSMFNSIVKLHPKNTQAFPADDWIFTRFCRGSSPPSYFSIL